MRINQPGSKFLSVYIYVRIRIYTRAHTIRTQQIEQIFNFPKQYGVVVAWIPDTRALMDRDLHDGSAVYPSVLSHIGGSPSFLPVSRSIAPFPKTETWPISTTVAPFYCLPRCPSLSLVREIKHGGGKKRSRRKKKKNSLFEQLLTTIASSRRLIVIRNEGKQVPPRLLLDRRELTRRDTCKR